MSVGNDVEETSNAATTTMPYVVRDRGNVFTFDPAEGRITKGHRLWKSRHESWRSSRFHTVEVLQTMYKGAEWYALQLLGRDTEDQPLDVMVCVGGRDERPLLNEARRIAGHMGFVVSQRKWTDPRPEAPSTGLNSASLAEGMHAYVTAAASSAATSPVVAKCPNCSLSAIPASDPSMAMCPYCDTTFSYGELRTVTIRVPEVIKDIRFDSDASLVAVGWSDRRGSFGCRAVDMGTGLQYDLPMETDRYRDLRVQRIEQGCVVAFSGTSEWDDDLEANHFVPNSIEVFDARDPQTLWSKPIDDEPLLGISGNELLIDWSGGYLTNAHPDRANERLDLRTGEPSTNRLAGEGIPGAVPANLVFPEGPPLLDGDAEFTTWSEVLARTTGLRPVMKMQVLQHQQFTVVNAHVSHESGFSERLVVLEGDTLRKNCELKTLAGSGAIGTAFDWNLTGFYVCGSLLVVQTAANEVVLISLT